MVSLCDSDRQLFSLPHKTITLKYVVLTLWMTRGIEIKDTYIDMTAINFDTLEVPVPCQS